MCGVVTLLMYFPSQQGNFRTRVPGPGEYGGLVARERGLEAPMVELPGGLLAFRAAFLLIKARETVLTV